MSNIFNSVSVKTPKRHKFKLNHQCKLTGEMGELLPIFCQDVIPGDRFRLSSSQLIRFAPLVAPIMSDIDVYTHFFFVPNRLIWSEWETFITGSKKGKKLKEEEIPVPPRLAMERPMMRQINQLDHKGYFTNCSLADYLQFPTIDASETPSDRTGMFYADELPFRAYQRIYFDWYRDENLSSFDDFDIIDGDEYNNGDNLAIQNSSRTNLLLKLQKRNWKKDYFTSALPFAQKGDDILIPGSSGGNITDFSNLSLYRKIVGVEGHEYERDFISNTLSDQTTQDIFGVGRSNFGTKNEHIELRKGSSSSSLPYSVGLNVDNFGIKSDSVKALSNIGEGTIRELRRAMAAQRFLEREAVGGTRYIEQILSFFGVKSSDARLQRTEFLGGSKQPVVVSQVLQTSQTTTNGDDASPLGQPAGNAVSAGGKWIFDREFEEHGFIIGIMSVIPRAEYMNGMPKKYLRRDRYDYYWPQFAHIGEQPIMNQELRYSFTSDDTDESAYSYNRDTFGYTPRYAEYRFINSHVHGDFKDTLKYWTLVRDFGQQDPKLNESFIECNPATRIFAYENSDFSHLWIQVGFNIDALRPLPKYGESI